MYQGLTNNNCEVLLVKAESHESNKNQFEYNPNCDLETVGKPLYMGTASFAFKSSVDLCSYILRDVLDLYIFEIIEDGTLDIKEQHYKGSQDCNAKNTDGEGNQSLSLRNLAGIIGGVYPSSSSLFLNYNNIIIILIFNY